MALRRVGDVRLFSDDLQALYMSELKPGEVEVLQGLFMDVVHQAPPP